MSRRLLSNWMTGLALAGLAVVLTAIFGWGVIGKHRLDQDARHVFKATRAICSEPAMPPCTPLDGYTAPVVPPPQDAGEVLVSIPARAVHPAAVRSAPSRGPPGA